MMPQRKREIAAFLAGVGSMWRVTAIFYGILFILIALFGRWE